MYSNFDYIKIDPAIFIFFPKCVRLLEIKKIIEGLKCRI